MSCFSHDMEIEEQKTTTTNYGVSVMYTWMLLECIIVEKCTKMSEELQGAPQAGKTEVADLEEEFDRASIPTEATKPEATEERKEVSVKSEDIPSPLQNATQLYGNLSDDVSQTKEMHPSSSASESSLNVDPMSKEEPSEKMAASSRFPDSVQGQFCDDAMINLWHRRDVANLS